MALRHRTEQEERQLRGVDRARDSTKFKLGQFRTLQNWIPAHVYSIHKKRGVELLVTDPIIPPIPTPCMPPPVGCPPGTLPEAQELPAVCCYDSNGFGDLTGNDAGMLAHVDSNGHFWHTASLMYGFPTGPYPDATPNKTWYLLKPVQPSGPSCALEEDTPLTLPGGAAADFQSTQTPQGGVCGKSDENCYALVLGNISPTLPAIGNASAAYTFFGTDSGVSYFASAANKGFGGSAWCKFADRYYALIFGFASNDKEFGAWPIPSPAGSYEVQNIPMETLLPGWDDDTFDRGFIRMIHATTSKLYMLVYGAWTDQFPIVNELRLIRLTRSTLTYETHWVLTGDPNFDDPWGIHALNDSTIFMIQGQWKIGMFNTATAVTTVIGTLTQQCTEAGHPVGGSGQHGFHYAKDYFYLSYSGHGFGTTNVFKIGPLVCPGTSIPLNLE